MSPRSVQSWTRKSHSPLERRKRELPALLDLAHGKCVEAHGERLEESVESIHWTTTMRPVGTRSLGDAARQLGRPRNS